MAISPDIGELALVYQLAHALDYHMTRFDVHLGENSREIDLFIRNRSGYIGPREAKSIDS